MGGGLPRAIDALRTATSSGVVLLFLPPPCGLWSQLRIALGDRRLLRVVPGTQMSDVARAGGQQRVETQAAADRTEP